MSHKGVLAGLERDLLGAGVLLQKFAVTQFPYCKASLAALYS